MKRPFLIYAILLIIAILLKENIVLFSAFSIIVILSIFYKFYKNRKLGLICLFPVVIILFYVFINDDYKIKDENLDKYVKLERNFSVDGKVVKFLNSDKEKTKIVLSTSNIYCNENIFKTNINVVITFKNYEPDINIGDNISVSGELKDFSSPRNEGTFNEKLYMKTRNNDYKMFVDTYTKLPESKNSFLINIFKLRVAGKEIYENIFPEKEAQIASSLIFGLRNDLPENIMEIYKRAGIFHILAISGLHINILSTMIFSILKKFGINKRKASLVSILLISIYIPFTGFMVSAIRAYIMSIVFLIGNILKREPDSYNSLGISALLILLSEPLYLYDAGFILSFVITAGIIAISRKTKGLSKLKKMIYISLASNFVSIPLIAYFYSDFTIWGIVANCLVLPFLPFIIGMLFLSCIFGAIYIPVGKFLGGSVYLLLKYIEVITNYLSSLPFSSVSIGILNHELIILYFAILFMIYNFEKRKTIYSIGIITCFITSMFLIFSNRIIFKNNEIVFFDVGQGDSALIKMYDGNNFLIDGGGNYFQEYGENTGKNIIIPYLEKNNIKSINMIFISHLDTDHALGALELMEFYNVKRVAIADVDYSNNEMYTKLLKIANEKKIEIIRLSEGDEIFIGEDSSISVLYPFETLLNTENINNSSLVLKYSYKDMDFLFTGDIDIHNENIMIKKDINDNVDVLKVAHHGSKYSTGEAFLNNYDFEYAVVSNGKNNPYNHPHPETMERLKSKDIDVFTTEGNGMIKFITNGENLKVKTLINT